MSRSAWPWILGIGAAVGAGALVVVRRPHWIGLGPAPSRPPTGGKAPLPAGAAPSPPAPTAKPSPLTAIPAAPASSPRHAPPHAGSPAPASPPSAPAPLPPGFRPPPGASAERGLEAIAGGPAGPTAIAGTGGGGPLPVQTDPEKSDANPDDAPAT